MPDALTFAVPIVVGVVFSVVFRDRMRRWVVRRRGQDAFDMGARVVRGAVSGVSGRWRHGIAVPADDGSLLWRGQHRLTGLRRSSDVSRRPTAREWLVVSPGARIHQMRSSTGAVLEIAVVPADAHHLTRLDGPRPQPDAHG